MLNASTIRGTFRQIPYWKLRGRFHSCGFRDQEIANAIGIGTDTMSKRMIDCIIGRLSSFLYGSHLVGRPAILKRRVYSTGIIKR